MRDQSQVLAAILRYNNSMPYAQNVLGWAAAYATGVVPDDLPPLVPSGRDVHGARAWDNLVHGRGNGPSVGGGMG